MNIGNLDLDEQEKPVRPPKIRAIRIIENPFDDIVPRITREEREAQRKAKLDAKREAEIREKRSKAKKWVVRLGRLLGFLTAGTLVFCPLEIPRIYQWRS